MRIPMRKMPWVKLAAGFLRDEKVHFIIKKYGHDTMVVWTGLLTECERGVLEMDEEIFAEVCIMDMQRFDEIKKIFIKFGLVTQCNGEKLKVTNWEKYQFSDSYERVKAHREKENAGFVTECNENETALKQIVTVDIEEDKENILGDSAQRSDANPIAPLDQGFSEAWAEYPNRSGANPKRYAAQAWNARLKEGHSKDEMLQGLRRYQTWCKETQKLGTEFVMQAKKFFGPAKYFAEAWSTDQPKKERRVAL